ncbi:AfsR/SARP family transcriptional regulator [Streptomyces sp. WMMC897]|uniref:AfsR/SARP family transcriptional regulator n=1 Tax=Streptomyces sp. WMMC897 TaxID=3014782 RepID=UPI0022B67541|nr:BTAD domain-containing putative transcriptional regulator [Streptomyces sp. WMMC897]MCZ7415534.1 BTAD domain-containing putative transcriptional regulator [Streptomyces sp. WMMC897]
MSNAVGTLRIQLLGPVRAWWDGQEVAAGPPQQRALLGLLASRAGEAVGREAVIEALWGGHAPRTAANGVHTYVAGLRRVLEPRHDGRSPNSVLTSEPGGYRLRVHPDAVDAAAFVLRHDDARRSRERGDGAATARLYEEALALWKGDAFSGIPGPFAALEGARLRDARLTAVEEWGAVMVAAGRHGEAVGGLSRAAAEEPLRERLRWLLMLALCRGGRQADSLRLYAETRRLLRRELGIEPGPELRDLHRQILDGRAEPAVRRALATPAGADTGRASVARGAVAATPLPRPAQLPSAVSGFTGRGRELEKLERLVGADRRAAGPAATVVLVQGPAGVGKSALVLRLAHAVSDRFPDGQVYVDLGGSGLRGRPLNAADAQRQVLTSLGVDGGRIPRDLVGSTALYRSLLYDQRMLVVLDDALSADQIRPLIPRGPSGVVATSRQRLAGLAARDGARTVTLGPLDEDAATLLLTTLTDGRLEGRVATARRLAALCGGLPLALRVLAERLTAAGEPPERLLERCASEPGRLDCLAVPDDALADVRSAFEASYQVLPAEAARMFRHLGMYRRGRITVRVAAALAGTDLPTARALLDVLVDAHLIEERGLRYRLPELLGVYAAECAQREPTAARQAALARLGALASPPRPRAPAAHGPWR